MRKRILSLLLCVVMLFSLCPQSALAVGNEQTGGVTIGTSGLCEHHPEHNADCGYTEGTAGTPCSHEHTDDCYTEVTDCVHEHTKDCYPQNSVSGNNATSSNADEPTECTHVCSEESGCITKQLNCQHEHDEDCGYTPATAGTPCGYVCEICGAGDNSAEAMTVERVQAMIDALPDAEEITEDNAEEVTAQLEAIDEAKAELTDEEIDELDITRYMAAAAALGSLAAPMLLANAAPAEQFNLTPGGTYWFDLSGENIPGMVNTGTSYGAVSVPDTTLHYVPFTYTGTVDAYVLNSSSSGQTGAAEAASQTTDESGQYGYTYPHSLFVADYAVTHTVSWNNLNTAGLIFGKSYTGGSVDYTLRAPSGGSWSTGSGDSQRVTPQSNEWDAVLDKNSGYIKNGNSMGSRVQDTSGDNSSYRPYRRYDSDRNWIYENATNQGAYVGFRPVLEVLNPAELGPDGLKAVTLDLNGGKLGGSTENIQIIVKNSAAFTAPASDGLTAPTEYNATVFKWQDSDGNLYAPGDSVPAGVTTLTAQWTPAEQFNLTPGGTYWFDLSGVSIPGTANSGNSYGAASLPDTSLHYVPFTYAGTIEAYKLTSEMATTEEYAEQNKYAHSLFVADYAVTHTISWGDLNTKSLIFGKDYASGGVDYTLRAPSVGSNYTGSGNSERGVPQSNEWDMVLGKNEDYIKNWICMGSLGQDTSSKYSDRRAIRGYDSARYLNYFNATYQYAYVGFRPVLEVLNPDTLGSDGLKAITLDLNGGKIGGSSDDIQIIVRNGSTFTAPASDGLTRPDGDTGDFFMWLGSDGNLYAPGESVPAEVTTLTAQWKDTTAPTGEIKIGTNKWTKFLNGITFGLFFNNTKEVTITATDNIGETVTIEYLLSDKELMPEELATATFIPYSDKFAIEPNNEYVIYAKLTDGSNNFCYINSNGIVLDNIVPVISGVVNGKTYCEAQTVTVSDKYEVTVTVNGTPVTLDTNGRFTLYPASGTQTVIATDKAGNVSAEMIVTINDGHEGGTATCKDKAVCDYCGEPYGELAAHTYSTDWKHDGTNHWHECSCGAKSDEAAHTGGTATCKDKAKCEYCGEEYGELNATNHTGEKVWTKTETQHEQKWNCCGATVISLEDHEWKDGVCEECGYGCTHTGGTATCQNKAKCEVCGELYGELAAHTYSTDWKHDGTNHWHECSCGAKSDEAAHTGGTATCKDKAVCSACGIAYGELAAHSYEDGKCTVCQAVDPNYVPETSSPQTGDNSNMALWIALLFISGGAVITLTVYDRKRRNTVKH